MSPQAFGLIMLGFISFPCVTILALWALGDPPVDPDIKEFFNRRRISRAPGRSRP